MKLKFENGKFLFNRKEDKSIPYVVKIGQNGATYVDKKSVSSDFINFSDRNEKTGPCVNFNFPIEYTCDHTCECYKKKICYASKGRYNFKDNQARYTENINFFNNQTSDVFIKAVQIAIDFFGYSRFRYFTCGDIPSARFIDCIVQIAKNNDNVKFWLYTKKYKLVNNWIAENGNFPENLVLVFSHWMNEDGSYFHMENPYKLPLSEFIPYGKEELKEKVTHICPCSDPSVFATCATCEHPCYKLQKGETMALLEHSTQRTKERDLAIKKAKKAL